MHTKGRGTYGVITFLDVLSNTRNIIAILFTNEYYDERILICSLSILKRWMIKDFESFQERLNLNIFHD